MQLEAALQRRILLDGQRNIFAILFLEEGADALLLMLIRRRDAKQRGRQTALLRIESWSFSSCAAFRKLS